jgi:hypothetical protein
MHDQHLAGGSRLLAIGLVGNELIRHATTDLEITGFPVACDRISWKPDLHQEPGSVANRDRFPVACDRISWKPLIREKREERK